MNDRLKHAIDWARTIRLDREPRDHYIVTAWTVAEHGSLEALAEQRGIPLAVLIQDIVKSALQETVETKPGGHHDAAAIH